MNVGDLLEGYGVRYRITELVREDGGGVWLARVDGAALRVTAKYRKFTRNGGREALLAIHPDKPLPENWRRI